MSTMPRPSRWLVAVIGGVVAIVVSLQGLVSAQQPTPDRSTLHSQEQSERPQASAVAPTSATTIPADYSIGPQDVLAVSVFDEADLSGKYAVEIDGTFTFPYIGRITAGGLTIRELEAALRAKLADGFFKNPQVAVTVDTYRSRRVFVLGEVKLPATLQLTGELTLMEAIARAGSTTEKASDDVVIVRGGQGAGPASTHSAGIDAAGKDVTHLNLRTLKAGAGVTMLQDGDTVFVGRVEPVYIYGQVKSPGSYTVRSDTTVLQALSLAGGGTPTGAVNRVRIIRVINGEKKEFKAALTDQVVPGDTLMVPERFF
jgi:polysaccharide export outer membrane protein